MVFSEEKQDDLGISGCKIIYTKNGDPWISINDFEHFHSLNGAVRRSNVEQLTYNEVLKKDRRMSYREPRKNVSERKRNISN